MNEKNHSKIKMMTLSALLAAFTAVATIMIQIPTPTKGYVNLGDCVVNIAGWILGPLYGAAAAGIGSSLADIISGYTMYAPVTLIIKALMAAASFFTFRAVNKRFSNTVSRIIAASAAELIMVFGYTMFEVIIYHSWSYVLIGTAGNIAQSVMGIVSSVAVYELVIKKIPNYK
ncbi:MAG TPA: ECF transporter S component [Ruminococcus sp.]|nr:ECF transporter S component [Ruminococcus sp.]